MVGPDGVVTTTLTVPATCAGAMASILDPLPLTVKLVAATEPNITDVAPLRWLRLIRTRFPPAPGPLVGFRPVMIGPTAVQVKLVVPVNPALSVTVTVTAYTPETVGVPLTVPEE